jgi:uncharacterized protein (DUF849 family)
VTHVRDEADAIAEDFAEAAEPSGEDLEARIRALIASRDATIATMEAQWHLAESGRDKLRVAARALLEGWDARRAVEAGKLGMGSNIATERAGAYTSTFYWEQLRKALDNRAQEEE